jgi:periplasmic protein TonB
MKTTKKNPDLNEIVFEDRNKEYGAYMLRKLYSKYVTLSTTGAMILFTLIASYPLITAFFVQEDNDTKSNGSVKVITLENIFTEIPDAENNLQIPKTNSPKTPSIKFMVPDVKPDALVTNEVIPTQQELSGKNPGIETVEGNINGTDVIVETIESSETNNEVTEKIYTWAEEMPKFPGGETELRKFFTQHLVYPEIAKRAEVEGKVILSFIVDKNGNIIDAEVAKSIGAGCDEEAMRVLNIMPRWIPGKQNGNPVLTRINIPVVFKLRS